MENKMLPFRTLIIGSIVFIILLTYSDGQLSEEILTINTKEIMAPSEPVTGSNDVVMQNIESLENIAKLVPKSQQAELDPLEDTDKVYEAIARIVQDLTELVKDVNNANIFLNADGIDRVIGYNILIPHDIVRANLLILLKTLFEETSATASVISEYIVDRLLNIFENERNLALKAHALDILYLWLPKNPEIQVRVMKLKGLEPFYNQVFKLDTSVIQTLLDLFNIILKEHLVARNEIRKIQKTKADLEKLRLYQRIGLLERMSTPTVCNGLLDILKVAWNYSNNAISKTVFDIIANIKPFCINIYGSNTKAIEIFDTLLKYVRNEENIENLRMLGINITSLDTVIQEYHNKINMNSKKDEL